MPHFNDGFTWKAMKPYALPWARGYLNGFASGYGAAISTKLSKDSPDYAIYSKFTGHDCPQHGRDSNCIIDDDAFLRAIDDFYDQPQNQDICLNWAIEFSGSRLAGNPYPDTVIAGNAAGQRQLAKQLWSMGAPTCPGL